MATEPQVDEYEDGPIQEESADDTDRYWPSLNQENTEFEGSTGKKALADTDPYMQEYAVATYLNQGNQEANLKRPYVSTWDKAETSFKKFNWMHSSHQAQLQNAMRVKTRDVTVSNDTLTEGVPDSQHGLIYQERDRFGELAAMSKRDQLRDVLATNAKFDALDGWEQFAFGAGAMLADPVNLAGIGALVKVEQGASALFKGVQQASIINAGVNGGRAWAASSAISNPLKLAGYASLGATEGAIMNVPQLAQDPTYTPTDYMYDIAFDATFGTAIGAGVMVWNRPKTQTHQEQLDASFRKLQDDLQRQADPVKPRLNLTEGNARWKALGDKLGVYKVDLIDSPEMQGRWEALGKKLAGKTDEDVIATRQAEVDATKDLVRTKRAELATPEVNAAMTQLQTLKDEFDTATPERQKEIRAEVAPLNSMIKAHRLATDTDEIKELMQYNETVQADLNNQVAVQEKGLIGLPELYAERDALRAEFNTVLGPGEIKPGVADGPSRNVVPTDSNEVRRREIRLRLDKIDELERDIKEKAKPKAPRRYATLAEVATVDKQTFDNVAMTLQGRFKKNSPIYLLVNRHQKLLRDKNLTPEVSAELNRLSADIVRLLSVTPEGAIPDWLDSAIREATFNQKHFSHKNVFDSILHDGTSDPRKLLEDYLDSLRRLDIWEGYDVQPVSSSDFFRENSEWLNPEVDARLAESGDVDFMQTYMSAELSFLRDVTKLNEFVKDAPELKDLVEELNGFVMTRLTQKEIENAHFISQNDMEEISETVREQLREWGYVRGTQDYADKFGELYRGIVEQAKTDAKMPEWADSRESWGKSVRMTPDDILRQVKREGYVSGTQEFKDRFRELSKSGERVAVPKEVNVMGKRKSRVISTARTDTLDRDEINAAQDYYAGNDADPQADKAVRETQLDLVVDEPDAGLLPKHMTSIRTESVYDTPTLENIKRMRNLLRTQATTQAQRLQVKAAITEVDTVKRMEAIIKGIKRNKAEVVQRAVNSRNLMNMVDVIRASEMVAREEAELVASKPEPKKPAAKKEGEPVKEPTFKEQVAEIPPKPLTEERIELLNPKIEREVPVTPVELAAIERDVLRGVAEVERDALETVQMALTNHVSSGADDAYQQAMKPKGLLDHVGRLLTSWTKDLGEIFLTNNVLALRYVGATLVETGAGFGGGARRKATAALIRDMEYKKSVSPMVMSYRDNLEKYAHAQGASAAGKLYALENAGINSGITDKFNREVFKEIENRKQGKPDRSKEAGVSDFVDNWEKYMSSNHDKLVDARISGFTKERKIKHYMPHVWKPHKLQAAIREHGLQKVHQVLTQGYLTSSSAGKMKISTPEAETRAWDLIKWIEGQQELDSLADDPFMPTLDSRAQTRMEINTTHELDGLSVLDLLETDVIGNGVRYSNRLAGWVGISKATGGTINSHHTIDALRQNIKHESNDKGADAVKNVQLYDDTIEMLFGRPTRGGLAPELRMLKDMTALTRMGGLGTAQLIETGQVIARSTLNLFSDPTTVKKVLQAGGNKHTERDLLDELQTLSGIRDDMEFLERQSIHLDEADMSQASEMRKASLWVADKITLGSLKAPAGRLLGKTTGFNMVRRAQTRINQLSFITDVARHFKFGTGKMGNARMADLGLTDVDGTDLELSEVFKKYVEFDANGNVVKLNADKWSESARDKFNLALVRDDAQNIQRTHVGELPPWMNSPLMALIMQFREMPMVAMNKSLRRSMAFADKEAVVGFMLNAAFAGLVRWSKFAGLGYGAMLITDAEWQEPNQEKMDTAKYITQFGLYADMYDLVLDSRKATEEGDVDKVLNNIPVLGLMQDYSDATGITEEQRRTQIDSIQGLTPLGNTAYGDMIYMWLNENFGE